MVACLRQYGHVLLDDCSLRLDEQSLQMPWPQGTRTQLMSLVRHILQDHCSEYSSSSSLAFSASCTARCKSASAKAKPWDTAVTIEDQLKFLSGLQSRLSAVYSAFLTIGMEESPSEIPVLGLCMIHSEKKGSILTSATCMGSSAKTRLRPKYVLYMPKEHDINHDHH